MAELLVRNPLGSCYVTEPSFDMFFEKFISNKARAIYKLMRFEGLSYLSLDSYPISLFEKLDKQNESKHIFEAL